MNYQYVPYHPSFMFLCVCVFNKRMHVYVYKMASKYMYCSGGTLT